MKKALFIVLLLSMTACAYVDPSLNDQSVIYSDSSVRKSALQVSVHPKGKQYRPLTAYFHPFVIQQANSDYAHLSNAFAQIFHNAWTEERLFPIQEFQSGQPYRGLQVALGRARMRGADLLILGFVPYFYAGTTLDDTAITIQINIYSVEKGQLLWTMVQSGRIEEREPEDYILFKHVTRLSDSSFNKIIRAIAKDMTIPLKGWLPDPHEQYPFATTSTEVKEDLVFSPSKSQLQMEQELPNDSKEQLTTKADRPVVKGVNLDIPFDRNMTSFKPEAYTLLDSLGEALNSKELKGRPVIIAGHTDATGSDQYNLTLSKQRADQVKQYLTNKWNVAPETLETVGYGKTRPLVSGATDKAMQQNRRVEIRLAE